MQWSRFNHLFRSEQGVSLLYNALSNTLLELDEAHRRAAERLRDREDGDGAAPSFRALLAECGVLVEAGQDDRRLLALQQARFARRADTAALSLAICPTLRCNFGCAYCFEGTHKGGTTMSSATVARLLAFVERHEKVRHLAIMWFGGEPLLAFDLIRLITEKIQALDVHFEKATLVTNGYLLDAEKILALNALGITSVQITLDGPQEVHDSRRHLAGGGPTFRRILDNVSSLLSSPYEGRCDIRVNVDRRNRDRFLEFRAGLMERYAPAVRGTENLQSRELAGAPDSGKRLSVYPAHVDPAVGRGCDPACGSLGLDEWATFELGVHRDGPRWTAERLYPVSGGDSICVATTPSGFVVGPDGELYKCCVDVGQPAMVVGSLGADEPVTTPVLQAQYLDTDPCRDPACLACGVLPICGGGCVNKRLRVTQRGEQGLEYCSPYRDHLLDYLRAYYEIVRSRDICVAVLAPGRPPRDGPGYRVVSPRQR